MFPKPRWCSLWPVPSLGCERRIRKFRNKNEFGLRLEHLSGGLLSRQVNMYSAHNKPDFEQKLAAEGIRSGIQINSLLQCPSLQNDS